jgi:CelD/BcsL family acetyltransferase involved in cellulose biosynthesis
MDYTLIPGSALNETLFKSWNEIYRSNPQLDSPYFTPHFTKAIAKVREDLEIVIISENSQIVGFFPFHRKNCYLGVPVGDNLADFQAVICRTDVKINPFELVKGCNLLALDFNNFLLSQNSFNPFYISFEESPRINLSCGYSAYVKEQRDAGSEQIKKIGNLMRRIEREVGPLRFEHHSSDSTLLEQVLSWKSSQYLESAKPDLFKRTWIHTLINLIHKTQMDGFYGMLSLLYSGEKLVAGHFGMRTDKVWHYWYPSYDPAFSKYSPGIILLLKMAEYAPTIGIQSIDLGEGLSFYKKRLMNSTIKLAAGRIEVPSPYVSYRCFTRKMRSIIVNTPLIRPARKLLNFLHNMKMQEKRFFLC